MLPTPVIVPPLPQPWPQGRETWPTGPASTARSPPGPAAGTRARVSLVLSQPLLEHGLRSVFGDGSHKVLVLAIQLRLGCHQLGQAATSAWSARFASLLDQASELLVESIEPLQLCHYPVRDPLGRQSAIESRCVSAAPLTGAGAHEILGHAVAAPDELAATVPATSVLSWKPSPLAGYFPTTSAEAVAHPALASQAPGL